MKNLLPANRPWSLSALALVGANLLPLLGVLFWDWSTAHVLLVYWAESAVIGIYAIARMIRSGGVAGVGFSLFFVVHYGGFMAGHLAFLIIIMVGPETHLSHPWDGPVLEILGRRDAQLTLLALLLSHGVSFVQNFLGREEWKRTTAPAEMFAPYARIVVMHVAIIFGFGIAMFTGSAVGVLAILILVKTVVDLLSHWREHQRRAAPSEAAGDGGRSADGP